MGVEYWLSTHGKYIGSVAIDSTSSSKKNIGIILPIAFLLKYRSDMVDEKNFEMMFVVGLKSETMHEW